jgi:hypothetical protein
VVAIDDHFVLEQHGTTTIAMLAVKLAGPREPALLAREVVGGHDHVVAIQKRDVHAFAVGGRRARGEAVELVLFFQPRGDNRLLPQYLAGLAIETQ